MLKAKRSILLVLMVIVVWALAVGPALAAPPWLQNEENKKSKDWKNPVIFEETEEEAGEAEKETGPLARVQEKKQAKDQLKEQKKEQVKDKVKEHKDQVEEKIKEQEKQLKEEIKEQEKQLKEETKERIKQFKERVKKQVKQFKDIEKGFWAEEVIAKGQARGVIAGYADGTFQPNKPVTRLETLAMVSRVVYWETPDEWPEKVKNPWLIPDWGRDVVAAAAEAGIITEADALEFACNRPAKRAEVACWLARALDLSEGDAAELTFKDLAAIHGDFGDYVAAVVSEGLIVGDPAGTFRPNSPVKRAEMAAILDRIVDFLDDELDDVNEDEDEDVDENDDEDEDVDENDDEDEDEDEVDDEDEGEEE